MPTSSPFNSQYIVKTVKSDDIRLSVARWRRKTVVQLSPVTWILSRTLLIFFVTFLKPQVCSLDADFHALTHFVLILTFILVFSCLLVY